ncbi:MAG: VWA domain-containing protein [Planctomycetes bacterium]|nr:VWA domain-containing protein [Planctomycetota bacterium]
MCHRHQILLVLSLFVASLLVALYKFDEDSGEVLETESRVLRTSGVLAITGEGFEFRGSPPPEESDFAEPRMFDRGILKFASPDKFTHLTLMRMSSEPEFEISERARNLNLRIDEIAVTEKRGPSIEVAFEIARQSALVREVVGYKLIVQSRTEFDAEVTILAKAADRSAGIPLGSFFEGLDEVGKTEGHVFEGRTSLLGEISLPAAGAYKLFARISAAGTELRTLPLCWIEIREPGSIMVAGKDAEEMTEMIEYLDDFGYPCIPWNTRTFPGGIEAEYDILAISHGALRTISSPAISDIERRLRENKAGLLYVALEEESGREPLPRTITSLLPVVPASTVHASERTPLMSIVLLIDTSMSMRDRDKIEYAKQAAIASVQTMDNADYIGVMSFDERPRTVIEPARGVDIEYAIEQISRMRADGRSTLIHTAISEAVNKLKLIDTPVRHLIVLSDGQDLGLQSWTDLYSEMKREKITVTAVDIGSESSTALTDLCHHVNAEGIGGYVPSSNFQGIPRIFTRAIRLQYELIDRQFPQDENSDTEPAIRRGALFPVHRSSEGALFPDIAQGLPQIQKFTVATEREGASVVLTVDEDFPLLVLGRAYSAVTAAWTSGLGADDIGPWYGSRVANETFAALLGYLITAKSDLTDSQVSVTAFEEDETTKVLALNPEGIGGAVSIHEFETETTVAPVVIVPRLKFAAAIPELTPEGQSVFGIVSSRITGDYVMESFLEPLTDAKEFESPGFDLKRRTLYSGRESATEKWKPRYAIIPMVFLLAIAGSILARRRT